MKTITFVLMLILIPVLCFAYTPDTCILGPGDGNSSCVDNSCSADSCPANSNLGTTGQDWHYTWKMFKWTAGGSGDAYVFCIYMENISGGSKVADAAFGVWEDVGDLGALKLWGYVDDYTFNQNTLECFDLTTVESGKSRAIVSGTDYWIGWRSTLGNDGSAYFSRAGGNDNMPADACCTDAGCQKVGYVYTITSTTIPFTDTPPSSYTQPYDSPNWYGWTVWTASDPDTTTVPTTSTTAAVTTTTTTCNVPTISGYDGAIGHGGEITLSGDCFGTKSPAKPLWWDDGEGATVDNRDVMTSGEMTWVTSGSLSGTNKHYNDVDPPYQGVGEEYCAEDNANVQYQSSGFRSMTTPHANSSTFIAGGHCADDDCEGGERGQNVAINISDQSTSDVWYIHYYLRLDDAWPAYVSGNNYKWLNWETGGSYNIYSSNNYHNINACSGGEGDLRRAPQCDAAWTTAGGCGPGGNMQIIGTGCGNSDCYPVVTMNTNVPNELQEWVRHEVLLELSADFLQERKNNVAMVDTELDETCDIALNTGTSIGGVTIGGFWKKYLCPNTQDYQDDDAYRYFDDVYVDTTFSRIMLCDNSTYADATICEPQIPSAWANDEITFTVNQGSLTGEVAYLFVFDDSNTEGDPYTVGLEEGTKTTTTVTVNGITIEGVTIQ